MRNNILGLWGRALVCQWSSESVVEFARGGREVGCATLNSGPWTLPVPRNLEARRSASKGRRLQLWESPFPGPGSISRLSSGWRSTSLKPRSGEAIFCGSPSQCFSCPTWSSRSPVSTQPHVLNPLMGTCLRSSQWLAVTRLFD